MEKTYQQIIAEHIKNAEVDRENNRSDKTLYTYYCGKIVGLEIALKYDFKEFGYEEQQKIYGENEFWTHQTHRSDQKTLPLIQVFTQGIKDGVRTAVVYYGINLTGMINSSKVHRLYIKPKNKKRRNNVEIGK